jgi:hypothetical protein
MFIGIPYYNISAPTPIFAVTGRGALLGYMLQSLGTGGVLTLNDCVTLEEASAANQILSLPYNDAIFSQTGLAGSLEWPLENGLVVSAVPNGMVLAVSYQIYINGRVRREPRRARPGLQLLRWKAPGGSTSI